MTRAATPADVIEGRARWCVVEGDAMAVLAALPDGCIDAVVTDPPYSSGGASMTARRQSTSSKYTNGGASVAPDFGGDQMDQWSWMLLAREWLGDARRITDPVRGRLLCFTDDRQWSALQTAIQWAGWRWMGAAAWDKGEGVRAVPDGMRRQCEFIHWATIGPLPQPYEGCTVIPGCYRIPPPSKRSHQTEKPADLMRQLARLCVDGGIVIDPFAGSGSTGVGALAQGRRVILAERVPEYAEIARRRCEAAEAGTDWKAPPQQRQMFEVAS